MRKGNRKRRNVPKQREKPRFLRPKVLLRSRLKINKPHQVPLNTIQDFRKNYDEYPKRIDGTTARIIDSRRTKKQTKNRSNQYSKVAFVDPTTVVICKRRTKRRQTLFKKRKIGKGRKVSKIRKRTEWSKVRC